MKIVTYLLEFWIVFLCLCRALNWNTSITYFLIVVCAFVVVVAIERVNEFVSVPLSD